MSSDGGGGFEMPGFKSNILADGFKAVDRAKRAARKRTVNDLGNEMKKSDKISDRTKQELNSQILTFLDSDGRDHKAFQSIGDTFAKAKEGTDPKFKGRQRTQDLFNTLVDKPDANRLRGQVLKFGSSVR